KPAKPPMPLTWYTSAGDKMEFSQSPASARLRLLGPFEGTVGKGKPPKVEDKSARITLDKGLLGLGLDEAAGASSRMARSSIQERFLVQPTPFGEAQIAEGRKAVALLQLSPSEQRALAGAFLALISYLELIQQTPNLDSIFEKVVDSPSLWSVVRHVGVFATLQIEPDHIAPAQDRKSV